MATDDQNILSSLQQQVGNDRYLPPKVLEDTPNEVAVYEKEVLQGAGGLLAGSSVEKGFKMLVKTPKGVKVLKKLGMSDEDVKTVVDAIKSRDSGALTDFLARKGTGFVESTAKKLGVKGGDITNTLKSTAGKGIKSVKSSLDDSIGDSSSKLSNLISKADDLKKGKSFGKVNKTFDRARAEIQGEDDLIGQSSAVKKLLQKSKKGRQLLNRNAKAKLKGDKIDQTKKPTSEFDQEDEQGDLLNQASKLLKPNVDIDQPIGDLNPFTGQSVDPLAKIKASKQKAEDELKQVKEQVENEGDRDPYQDIYDQANRDSQKFTDSELGVGNKLKKDVDFKFKAPTREEHLEQLADQEKQTSQLPDSLLDVFKDEEVKPTIPASEQTGGIDPSTLPDDAGFQRGSAKIQAKKDVDPTEEPKPPSNTLDELKDEDAEELFRPIIPTVPEPPKPELDDTDEIIQKTKIPDAPEPPPPPEPPKPQLNEEENISNPLDKLSQNEKPIVDTENIISKGDKVESGIKTAFEDSLADDESPMGVLASAVLGVGALIGGALRKAHHPKFIQPPPIHEYENYSVQEGVA